MQCNKLPKFFHQQAGFVGQLLRSYSLAKRGLHMNLFWVSLIILLVASAASASECETESLAELKERTTIKGPLAVSEIQKQGDALVLHIEEGDEIYSSYFSTDPKSDDYYAYESYVLVKNNCVVSEISLWHDN